MSASASPMTTWSALSSVPREAAGDGSADHGAQAARVAAVDDGDQRVALDVHAAEQNHVGPGQVAVAKTLDVGVDQALVPGGRKQRGDGHQSEGRLRGAFAQESQGMFESSSRYLGTPGR
jgi:hypothetical protein